MRLASFSALAGCLALMLSLPATADDQVPQGTVILQVRHGSAPVQGAEVSADGRSQIARSDARGELRLILTAGRHELILIHSGFAPATLQLDVPRGESVTAIVQVRQIHFEEKVTVVSATRSGTIVQDQAIRVEAVPEEEIEENLTAAPGNVTTLLEELGGVRLQSVAPGLGGTSLRFQGLPGRYTLVLSDELPIYGQEPDSFSLLEIPPLDLDHVEVIKGTASALYGGTALGGVLNLVSRRPGVEPELLLSQTSHGGTDAAGFASGKLTARWGWTLLGSADRQRREDIDGDGWADLPGSRRATLRPRLFWNDGVGHDVLIMLGGTVEDRNGGTVGDATLPDGSEFREERLARRLAGGVVGRFLVGGDRLISVHASVAEAWNRLRFGDVEEHDRLDSTNAEVTLSGTNRGHTWLVGGSFDRARFLPHDISGFDTTYSTPGILLQDEYAAGGRLTLAGSARVDFHSRYGARFSPRLSALLRPWSRLNVRFSAGMGYSAPMPRTDETEEVGLSGTLPPRDLEPVRAESASLDVGWQDRLLELNGTLFASRVQRELLRRPSAAEPGRFELINSPLDVHIYGSELLARVVASPLHVIGMYTLVRSTGADAESLERREVPLTPRHSGELAAIVESEDRGRIGVELSYTGVQRLENDPYRERGKAFVEANVLAELRIGRVRVFANALDVTDVRQTRFDSLLLPERTEDGRPTTDVWAPLEGRTFNAGVRLEF